MNFRGRRYNFQARTFALLQPAATPIAAAVGQTGVTIVGPTHAFVTPNGMVRYRSSSLVVFQANANDNIELRDVAVTLETGVGGTSAPISVMPFITVPGGVSNKFPMLSSLGMGFAYHGDFRFDGFDGVTNFSGSSLLNQWRLVFKADVQNDAALASSITVVFREIWEDWILFKDG